jgi:hypothetical protein
MSERTLEDILDGIIEGYIGYGSYNLKESGEQIVSYFAEKVGMAMDRELITMDSKERILAAIKEIR